MMQPELPERDMREADAELAETAGDGQAHLQRLVQRVFGTEHGRELLAWLRRYVHHGRSVLVPGEPDTTAFMCGRQDPINMIVNLLTMPYAEVRALMEADSGLPKNTGADPMWSGPVKDDFLYPEGHKDGHAEIQ